MGRFFLLLGTIGRPIFSETAALVPFVDEIIEAVFTAENMAADAPVPQHVTSAEKKRYVVAVVERTARRQNAPPLSDETRDALERAIDRVLDEVNRAMTDTAASS